MHAGMHAETEDSAGVENTFSTQQNGRYQDDEETLPAQTVAPRELEAILRFKPACAEDNLTPREERLKLPTEFNSENLINLGRLKLNKPNSAQYQQLVRLYDQTRL